MFIPFGYYKGTGTFIPKHSPYAYYDGLNEDSFDATNKTWSDIAEVNTTDDSTFDTAMGVLPTHNSNGYFEITDNNGASDEGFRYSGAGDTTNPFSFIAGTTHTMITYVRVLDGDGGSCDILGNNTSAGAVLLGAYSIGTNNFARGHVWATGAKFTDTPNDSVTTNTWQIIGQRYADAGSGQRRVDAFVCDYNGTVSITQGTAFTPGAITATSRELGTGRYNEVKGEYDFAAYALYRTDLTDSQIQDVCDGIFGRFGEPT